MQQNQILSSRKRGPELLPVHMYVQHPARRSNHYHILFPPSPIQIPIAEVNYLLRVRLHGLASPVKVDGDYKHVAQHRGFGSISGQVYIYIEPCSHEPNSWAWEIQSR